MNIVDGQCTIVLQDRARVKRVWGLRGVAAAWLIKLEGISSTNARYQIITHNQTFDIIIQHDCMYRMPQYFQASTLEIVLQKITAKTLLLILTTSLYQS